MEDPFITITTNIPETPAGNRVRRIMEFVDGAADLIMRPVKLANKGATWKGGIVIQPKTRDSWLVMIEPYKNRVILKGHGEVPFNDSSEAAILEQILGYYHDQVVRGI